MPPLPKCQRLGYVAGMSRGKQKQPPSALAGLFEELEAGEAWEGPWTERQRRFAISYLRHGVGARAVREAGYNCKTEHAADCAVILLRRPHVKAFIQEHQRAARKRLEVTAERTLGELAAIGYANLGRIVRFVTPPVDPLADPDVPAPAAVPVLALEEATEADLAAVQEIEFKPDGSIKVKLAPKTPALDLLGKHLKLFTDRLEVEGQIDIASTIQEARQRARARRAAQGATNDNASGDDGGGGADPAGNG